MPEWSGMTLKSTVRESYATQLAEMFQPFKSANWEAAFHEATFNKFLVNSPELRDSPSDTPSGWTLLHFIANAGAPAWVADCLVEAGAARCVKDSLGRTPLDLAKAAAGSGQDLLNALTPQFRIPPTKLDNTQLDAIETNFHSLIRDVSCSLVEENRLILLPVRVLLESHFGTEAWQFSIPGMYGGFYNIHLVLDSTGGVSHLQCESWCRVVGGSGRRDKVTAEGVELLAEGFV